MARVSEKAEQAAIVELVQKLGGKVWVLGHPSPNDGRTHRGTGQSAGIPDLWITLPHPPTVLLQPARAFWWEVKAKAGVLSPAQREFQVATANAGGFSLHGTADDFIRQMQRWGYVKAAA